MGLQAYGLGGGAHSGPGFGATYARSPEWLEAVAGGPDEVSHPTEKHLGLVMLWNASMQLGPLTPDMTNPATGDPTVLIAIKAYHHDRTLGTQ